MNAAVILAGGNGTRMGAGRVPKQYRIVQGEPILIHSLRPFAECAEIDGFLIVCEEIYRPMLSQYTEIYGERFLGFADPGNCRQASIRSGLEALRNILTEEEDIVFIQDAVRPLTTENLIRRILSAFGTEDGILPVIPVKDTVYYSEDGSSVKELLARKHIFAGQAPEAFRYLPYLRIHEEISEEELQEITGSSEAALRHGLTVKMIPGDERNFKITTPEDFETYIRLTGAEE